MNLKFEAFGAENLHVFCPILEKLTDLGLCFLVNMTKNKEQYGFTSKGISVIEALDT